METAKVTEPIDAAWLERIGFRRNADEILHLGPLWYSARVNSWWLTGGREIPRLATRADVLELCRLLGCQTEESEWHRASGVLEERFKEEDVKEKT